MNSPIDRLTALDQLMLRAGERWPQDIGALALLDGTHLLDPTGRLRIEAVRDAIGARLHLVPRFRQVVHVPARGLSGLLWVDAPAFDVNEHVRVLPLAAGSGEADLLAATEHLRRQRLDPSRPLWQMWFMPGLPNQRIAMFVRVHHCIADGMAAMATISALLDAAPDAPATAAPPWRPVPWPSARELLADNLTRHVRAVAGAVSVLARPRTTMRHLLAAWPAIRELLAEEPRPETSLDRIVGPDRNLALIRSTLDRVKQVAHSHDATVNDVLLAVTAGGLRALLHSRGEPVEGTTVPIYVPVSLRPPGARTAAGQRDRADGGPAPTRSGRPRRSASTDRRGDRRTQGTAPPVPRDAVPRQGREATAAQGRHPATRERNQRKHPGSHGAALPCRARVLDVFPVLPLIANEPLGVGALSYAGTFTIGVVADRDAYPDIDVLTTGMREELHELGSAVERDDDVRSAPKPPVVSEGRR
jgi:diacylglycerol O-acyltransferase / wax synthase